MSTQTETPSTDARTIVVPGEGVEQMLRVRKSMLLVTSGPHQGEEYIIDRDVFSIGSGKRNDLVLKDSTVSRHHCEIRLGPEGHLIRDMGSTNGTIVRDVPIREAFLTRGAEFQLGGSRIVFCPLQEEMEIPLSASESFGSLIGRSIPMRRVFYLAETYAPSNATILIEGETGTGKEVLAEEIHRHSRRAEKPFIVIDCAALAHELIESELFGHTRGAFTGASQDRTGAFEHADGGTVFLDEISDLSPDLQPKLLRVLEKRQIRKVGSNDMRQVDVRIISATNRRLENAVNDGTFREDLYYRLSVVRIPMPPLRQRREDIAPLVRKFLREFEVDDADERIQNFDRVLHGFSSHDWPGNVRELRNLVEIAASSRPDHRPLDLASYLYLDKGRVGTSAKPSGPALPLETGRPFKEAKAELVARFERAYIDDLLQRSGGNVSRAAREAGIERAYLQRLLKKHGMN